MIHADDETPAVATPACPEGSFYVPHKVAYCDGFSCHTVVEEGRCVPQEVANTREADAYTCGNTQCVRTFFARQGVCCVTQRPDRPVQYSCRTEPISCPGNMDKVKIRTSRNQTPSES